MANSDEKEDIIARPPVVIAGIHTKIENGRFTDETNLKFALDAVQDLVAEVAMLRAVQPLEKMG